MKRKEKDILLKSNNTELTKQIKETRIMLGDLAISQKIKPNKNSREARKLRNKLAVLLTAFRQKELMA